MTWAYAPSYARPLSVPQGVATLFPRFGMDVVIAHPPGFDLMPEVMEKAQAAAKAAGSTITYADSMEEAFEGADVVYPKSWGRLDAFSDDSKALAESGAFSEWICDEQKLALASPDVLYLHCLPADRGREVTDAVIDGPHSVVWDEAENRMHTGKALMALTMGGYPDVTKRRSAVVAIGGNSLIKDTMHQSVRDQYVAAGETCWHIASMIKDGWDVAIGHGNGPQVGFILRRSELAAAELHEVPLDVCGADSQGAIGYALAQNLENDFRRIGIDRHAVSVVTQMEVAADDPAFANPSKPIGSFMDEPTAQRRHDEEGWAVREDAGRGWRRVVASPAPLRIVEEDAIRTLMDAGFVVVSVGGGGIPVVADADGNLTGVAAVIDKDLACSLLATVIGAELLLITTAVEKVALAYGTPEQEWVDRMTLSEAKEYLAAGTHFAEGSMGPKIRAVIGYLERGGTTAIVTDPENVERALAGETGTTIVQD